MAIRAARTTPVRTADTMIVTATFDEHDGKTTLTIHTLFESIAMKNRHLGLGYDQGTGSALDQLGDLVARLGGGRPS